MRFIHPKIHTMLDYIVGIVLVAAPWLFGFSSVQAAKWVAVAVGLMVLILSFMTDFAGTGKRAVSMSAHLIIDFFVGVFLAASPIIFGFDDQVYLPHVVVGIFAIVASFCTETKTEPNTNMHDLNKMRHAH